MREAWLDGSICPISGAALAPGAAKPVSSCRPHRRPIDLGYWVIDVVHLRRSGLGHVAECMAYQAAMHAVPYDTPCCSGASATWRHRVGHPPRGVAGTRPALGVGHRYRPSAGRILVDSSEADGDDFFASVYRRRHDWRCWAYMKLLSRSHRRGPPSSRRMVFSLRLGIAYNTQIGQDRA